MDILHITPYYAPAYPFGGVVRAVEGMARALIARGHSVTVLTTDALSPRQRCDQREEMRDGVRVMRVPNALPRTFNLSTPRGMGRVARELIAEADVVHCHEFRTVENSLVTGVARESGKPLLLSPHGTLTLDTGRSALKSVWDFVFSPRLARRFDTVIGLTRHETDEARKLWTRFGAAGTRFEIVPNGVTPDDFVQLDGGAAFRARYGLGDAVVCLFMGRLHPRKGAHLLARAFRQADIPNTRLVIAGPDEGGLDLIRPHLDERIVLTGFLDERGRASALAAANLFALPAVGEGLSMALLEAMSAGLPVLITPGCHLPEAAEAGAGVEVARNIDALAEALRVLLSNSAMRDEMGRAARRLVNARFTWETVAEQLENVYAEVIKERKYELNRQVRVDTALRRQDDKRRL